MNAMPMFYPFCAAAFVLATLCVNLAISAFESRTNPVVFHLLAVVVIVGVTALAVVLR